ncbi:protein WALLS ARE THIN 1-like isoform X2 [Castanea sativa]|uniref:protein WALLS ARE THIN 1-like isoform X2 n=1 Tax=Castanea sativa TaxID=21020 RepID=UPI003F650EF8
MSDSMAEASSDSAQRRCAMPERAKLHLAMIVCQLGFAGNHIIMKIALNMGISLLVFPIYRNIVALVALVPFAYFLEKRDRPPISISLLLQFFILGLIGLTCNQEFYYLGLDNTSATFASASENSVPAITFLMAAIFGMEQVHLNRKDGIAKVLGTVSTVAGSLVITLYKGPTLFESNLQSHQSYFLLSLGNVKVTSWTLGCIYLIGHCLCCSSWIIIQTPLLKKYPARLSIASFAYFFSILQYLVIAVAFERDSQAWIVNSTDELLTIFYTIRIGGFCDDICNTNICNRQGRTVVCFSVSTSTDLACCYNRSHSFRPRILLGRDYWSNFYRNRTIPCCVGKR